MIEFKEPEKIFLKDLNSLNGTFLNKQRVPNNTLIPIQDSDEISFGKDPTVYSFFIPPPASQETFRSNYLREGGSFVQGSSQANATVPEGFFPSGKTRETHFSAGSNLRRNDQKEPQECKNKGDSLSFQKIPQGQKETSEALYENKERQREKQVHELTTRLLERESLLKRRELEVIQLQNQLEALKEELHFAKAKEEGIELYSQEMHRKIEKVKQETQEQANLELELVKQELSKVREELKVAFSCFLMEHHANYLQIAEGK